MYSGRRADLDAELRRKVARLKRPCAYPELPTHVEAIETHMSWVFLTPRHAFKLKKPVHYPFLDFSTLQARRFYCREEVRLNRRLAPWVYLGVVALTELSDGDLSVAGRGRVVDWLVKMQRLQASRMLDAAVAGRRASRPDAIRLAEILLAFYRRQPRVELAADRYRDRFRGEILASAEVIGGVPILAAAVQHAVPILLGFVDGATGLLTARATEGRLCEGHGDLRPEHVYLAHRPAIIDCLEFDRRLRILDPLDELAYFAMECERLGAAWLGEAVLARYQQGAGERVHPQLVWFYKAYRALLRGKLCVWHMAEPGARTVEHWIGRTAAYVDLAGRYADHLADG
ncbi:aminoglycoside phosphotransferase family enzyme [Constrictibacter sp. MBR-5]